MKLTKSQAIELFGTKAELARAVGIRAQSIHDWPEHLTKRIADRVMWAAYQSNKKIPLEWRSDESE